MKRMQAIVSGRKKQCTKLPKPALKEKKSPSTPEANPGAHSRSPPDAKGTDKDGGGTVPVSGSGSMSSASSSITADGSSSITPGAANSTSRAASKIPGTSPKKTNKDGGGWTLSSKAKQRQDKHGIFKSESFNKKSSKEKQKGGNVKESAGEMPKSEESGSKHVQRMTSHEDPGYVRENRYADKSHEEDKIGQASEENKTTSSASAAASPSAASSPSGAAADSSQSTLTEENVRQDQKLQTTNGARTSEQSNVFPKQSQDNQRTALKSQNNQPLHGILKDSSSSESTHSATMNYHQNGSDHLYSVPNSQHREYSSSRNQPPARASSFRENHSQFYQAYGSLPRSSRSTTPTPEAAYGYGSFPRRANVSTPMQQNVLYSGSQEWGSLSRKAESDSVYPMGHMDRDHRSSNSAMNYGKSNYGITGYSNESYDIVNPNYRGAQRSGMSSNDLRNSGYHVSRAGIVPAQYSSDTEAVRYHREIQGYNRGVRGGSVPPGYDSDSGAYAVLGHGQPRFGTIPRNYEVEPGSGVVSASSLRVHPDDEQYRAGPGKRLIPRRHTVGTSSNRMGAKDPETERKREAFMQLLAHRYPQYADRIQGVGSSPTLQPHLPDKPTRSREGQRSRAALVAYNPNVTGSSMEYDDIGVMSDLEVSSFQRGGLSRTSLPIVRSASTSLERPLGLVFLVYGDQTKKSLLPNEITTLDTVRALFVRAFPDLTLDTLENPRKKIYLLDPATNIYFQLEDLA